MRINARLLTPQLATSDELFARVARCFCEGAILANRAFLQENPHTPKVLESGVVYQNEPENAPDELLAIPTIIAKGWGDCMHLTCWRVAELREQGEERARVFFDWAIRPDGMRVFHVQVRRGNGKIEDISRLLGM